MRKNRQKFESFAKKKRAWISVNPKFGQGTDHRWEKLSGEGGRILYHRNSPRMSELLLTSSLRWNFSRKSDIDVMVSLSEECEVFKMWECIEWWSDVWVSVCFSWGVGSSGCQITGSIQVQLDTSPVHDVKVSWALSPSHATHILALKSYFVGDGRSRWAITWGTLVWITRPVLVILLDADTTTSLHKRS